MTNLDALISVLPVAFSANTMEKALLDAGIDGTLTYTAGSVKAIDLVAIGIVEWLIVTPDITEGGYSIKYDRASILIWLDRMKSKYDLIAVPTIKGIHPW